MEQLVIGTLLRLSFAGGFLLAVLLGIVVAALLLALRLWLLREELNELVSAREDADGTGRGQAAGGAARNASGRIQEDGHDAGRL